MGGILTQALQESRDSRMTWVEKMTGIMEARGEMERFGSHFTVEDGGVMRVDGERSWHLGTWEHISLGELRQRVGNLETTPRGAVEVRQEVANVAELHFEKRNAGAIFQVASQFNCLEMATPELTPEDGVGIYEHDHTQGPACAIACGAATVFRNYLVKVPGATGVGQTASAQLDGARLVHDKLKDLLNAKRASVSAELREEDLWSMQNGYLFFDRGAELVGEMDALLADLSDADRESLKQELKFGVHWDTEVTPPVARSIEGVRPSLHQVGQIFCSAVPIAYSHFLGSKTGLLERFSRLVLESAYEATLLAAVLKGETTGTRGKVYLTLLGGGVFGNEIEWIVGAMQNAIEKIRRAGHGLEIIVVAYRQPVPEVTQMIEKLQTAGETVQLPEIEG